MSRPSCTMPPPLSELLDYWLGEFDLASEARLEEHLFGCAECSARLERLVQLADAVKHEAREGHLHSVVTAPFIRRLREAGVRVREYRLAPGGSVNCTVTPEDDLVVAHLQAPLENVRRLDLVLDEGFGGARRRLENVAFDPMADTVVLAPSVTELRRLGVTTQRVELVAVDDAAERVIGTYTFNHSPYRRAHR